MTAHLRNFSWDDSNGFRWETRWVAGTPDGKQLKIIVEKDAPYTQRTLFFPNRGTQAEVEKAVRAFVEASVAIPQKGAAKIFQPSTKTPTDKLNPPLTKAGKPNGWGVIILLGLLALASSKGSR